MLRGIRRKRGSERNMSVSVARGALPSALALECREIE
jgi:hypothetical protein